MHNYKEFFSKNNNDTIICGILNVTPDSFSDGGKYTTVDKALKHVEKMVEQGAGMIDIGGESTRPGCTPVSAEEEIHRLIPVIEKIKENFDLMLSVDTWKSRVAEAALKVKADIINDITGLWGDPDMATVIAKYDAGAIIMFNPTIVRPNHPGSQAFIKFPDAEHIVRSDPAFNADLLEIMDILDLCRLYFNKSLIIADQAGINPDNIILDPGIGFGLTKKENLQLLKAVDFIHAEYRKPSFVGISRKRFITNILSENGYNINNEVAEGLSAIDFGTANLTAIIAFLGVNIVRTHEVHYNYLAKILGSTLKMADDAQNINYKSYS